MADKKGTTAAEFKESPWCKSERNCDICCRPGQSRTSLRAYEAYR
jgi:hypothetical protein